MYPLASARPHYLLRKTPYAMPPIQRSLAMLMLSLMSLSSCAESTQNISTHPTNMKHLKELYFAGGCFWGTQHFIKQIEGVHSTQVGYANGRLAHAPSYQEVCTGRTGFAETVKVSYDPKEVSLELLIDLYLKTIDPCSLNKQGGDIGTQYRTGIYYTEPSDAEAIRHRLDQHAGEYPKPIVVEVEAMKNFYLAEEYHQNYLDKHAQGYCHIHPSLFTFAKNANKRKAQTPSTHAQP
ncbi:MAG: peptide-methionine (S)-S-oxide reductase MsrA [Bacteroidales bacterium]